MMLCRVVLTDRPSKWIQSTGAGLLIGSRAATVPLALEVDERGAPEPEGVFGVCGELPGGVAADGELR